MEPQNNNLVTPSPLPAAESKSSIQISGGYYDSQTWAVMKMMAQTFIDAKAFPTSIQNVPQAMTILQAGREIGMMPVESLKYITLINGRPSLWGEKAIEMVIRAGHTVEWTDCNEKTATCKITRGDTGKWMVQTFTMAMANERGLAKKGGPWLTAPENMLKFKAFHAIAKFLVPDALHGISIAEIEETEPSVIHATMGYDSAAPEPEKTIITSTNTRLKPLAARMAEKVVAAKQEDKKVAVIEAKVVESEPAATKPADEPVYEPIEPVEPPAPVIQVEAPSPLPPAKPTEGVAARKMREAAERMVAAKSPDQF